MFCKQFLKSQNKIDFFHPKTKAEWTCNEKSNITIESCLNKPQLNYLWVPYNGSIYYRNSCKSLLTNAQLSNCTAVKLGGSLIKSVFTTAKYRDGGIASSRLSNLCLPLVLKTCISTLSRRYEHSFGLCWDRSSIQKGENSETIKYTRLHTDLWAS